MSGHAVKTADLSLRYGSTTALRGVDLDLAADRIHGLLGRNGTGKTTLLSALASLRRPHIPARCSSTVRTRSRTRR